MFRSDLQGGIGSILGNHLDPYRQYLQQTYIQPQSQQQLNLFMDSIQQQEQEFFGPPVSGGQMSSAANPGSTLALGGLPPPLGQVGSLAQNPFMAVSSFDAQVARTQNTPAYSGPEIGRKRAHMTDQAAIPGLGTVKTTLDPVSAFGSMTARASDRMQGAGLGNPFGSSILGPRI